MPRQLTNQRQDGLRSELRLALLVAIDTNDLDDRRELFRAVTALGEFCHDPQPAERAPAAAWRQRYEAAVRMLHAARQDDRAAEAGKKRHVSVHTATNAWIDRYLLNVGSHEKLVKDPDAHRRWREQWLARLRDRDRRATRADTAPVKLTISRRARRSLATIARRAGDATLRAAAERLIAEAERRLPDR